MAARETTDTTPLRRSLGIVGVTMLALSVTSPVSSLFVIVPGMFAAAGTGAIWAMLLAGVVCVATAFIYAELSSAWPVAGGEYVMVAQTLGPLPGFVMLGVNMVNNMLFPPAIGLGLSAVLAGVVPGLPVVPVAVVVVGGATLLSLLRIKVNAWITGVFLAVELIAVLAVVVLGLGDVVRPVSDLLTAPVMIDHGVAAPASAGSIGLAASIAIFALNGYGTAVYFGEEMHAAPRRIAVAVLSALSLTLLCEAVPMVALLMGTPDLFATLADADPFGSFVRARAGTMAADMVAIGVALSIVNAVIACILASARFCYGTGRDACWGRPVDAWLTAIHPRHGSPWIGTLIVGGAGVLCCFLPLSLLLVLSGTGLVAIYAGIALAVIVGRRRGLIDHAHFRAPLHPLAPAVTLGALACIVWLSWNDGGTGRLGLGVTAIQILLSVAYYQLVLKRRGQWDVRVPEAG